MSEDNNNSNNDLSREELNEQLDELRLSQRESANKLQNGKTSDGKKRSRWDFLMTVLATIGGLFLFWRVACRPLFVMCYSPVPDRNRNEEEIRPTCYEIVIPDDNDIPDAESSPAVSNSDAALEEVQQYYEKVKQESFLNNADNAKTNNDSNTLKDSQKPTEE